MSRACWPIHPQLASPFLGASTKARACAPATLRNVNRVDSVSAQQATGGLPYCLPPRLLEQERYRQILRGLAGDAAELELPRRHTCAVVGSYAWLNGSKLGPQIDGHDVVLRINRAPARGSAYEADVGRRTSIRVLDPVSKYDFDPRVLEEDSERLLFTLSHPFTFDRLASHVLQAGAELPPWNFSGWSPRPSAIPRLPTYAAQRPLRINASRAAAVINPELYLWALLIAHGGAWGDRRERAIRPTTGFISVMVALHLCERTTLFGFSWGSGDAREKRHYYAMLPPYNRPGHIAGTYHDPENEFALLRNLAAARIVGFFPPMAEPPPSPWRWHDCEVTERRTAVS